MVYKLNGIKGVIDAFYVSIPIAIEVVFDLIEIAKSQAMNYGNNVTMSVYSLRHMTKFYGVSKL